MTSFDKKLKEPIPKGAIEPMTPIRGDICPFCKAQRIELFSFKGYPQNYTQAVEAHLRGYDVHYNSFEIRFMRCKSCNREFTIDWSTGFPFPLKDTYKTNKFFQEFINGF